MIKILSSWGHLLADNYGNVVGAEVPQESGLQDVKKFDLQEFKRWYPKFTGKGPAPDFEEYDILWLGYWLPNGFYVEPADDYRRDIFNPQEMPSVLILQD